MPAYLGTEPLGRGAVPALHARAAMHLLGVNSAADAVGILDVELGQCIAYVSKRDKEHE